MIKKIENADDLIALIEIFPNLANCPLHDEQGIGLLDEYDDTLGTFYDDEKQDVFYAWVVHAKENEMTFIMKSSFVHFWDENGLCNEESVLDWHWGIEDSKEEEISWITRECWQ